MKKTKFVHLKMSLGEKKLWLVEFRKMDMGERGKIFSMAGCIRDCVRQTLLNPSGRWPIQVERLYPDDKAYDDEIGVQSLRLDIDDWTEWQRAKFKFGYTALDKMALDVVRRVLSIRPYGLDEEGLKKWPDGKPSEDVTSS